MLFLSTINSTHELDTSKFKNKTLVMCPKDDNQVPGPPLSFILLLNSHLPPQAAGGMNGWLSDQPACSGYKCWESCQGQAPHRSESLTGKQPGGEFSPPSPFAHLPPPFLANRITARTEQLSVVSGFRSSFYLFFSRRQNPGYEFFEEERYSLSTS